MTRCLLRRLIGLGRRISCVHPAIRAWDGTGTARERRVRARQPALLAASGGQRQEASTVTWINSAVARSAGMRLIVSSAQGLSYVRRHTLLPTWRSRIFTLPPLRVGSSWQMAAGSVSATRWIALYSLVLCRSTPEIWFSASGTPELVR